MADMIDEMLRADEEALKAKKQRLRALEKTIQAARSAIDEARSAVLDSMTHDGLSRADLARTFELTSRERALFVPSRSEGRSAAQSDPAESSEDASAGDAHSASADGGQWASTPSGASTEEPRP